MSFTAGSVMDQVASLLNDTAKSVFSYTAQLPYLKMAFDELKTELENNNFPMTNKKSSVLTVPAATTEITFSSSPALPSDLIDVQGCFESPDGSTQDYLRMTSVDFLPENQVPATYRNWYAWAEQSIKLLAGAAITSLKIEYIADTLGTITDDTSTITLINGKPFLTYRTAALCASFIGENPTRAEELNGYARMQLDNLLGISSKTRQQQAIRRRPFRRTWQTFGR